MIKFCDNYKEPTEDVLGDGQEWTLMQRDCGVLENRRKELGMTQQQVADKAKVQLRQYQRFENGERTIASASMRIGLSICCALELDPRRFIAETFDMLPVDSDR